jgi:hypothetical protein
MADTIQRITYSLELTASDDSGVWPLAYYSLGNVAPVVPEVGSHVGANDKAMKVNFVRHQFSSEEKSHLHHHVGVYGTILQSD